MNNKINLTLNEAGSLLLGAGLMQLTQNIVNGLIIVVVGALLKIIVAVLKKYNVVISSRNKE